MPRHPARLGCGSRSGGRADSPRTARRAIAILTLLLMAGIMLTLAVPHTVRAESSLGVTVNDVAQYDTDDDGTPDLTMLDCQFATEHDRVLVYDGAGDMTLSDDWRTATDFDNDTWLFDAGADDRIDLIIVFGTDGAQHTAHLYDDRDGDGQVAYRMRNGRVVIEESSFWTAEVRADGDWWNDDGRVNRNLLISVDGPIGTLGLDSDYALDAQPHDGTVDLEMEINAGRSAEWPTYSLGRSFSRPDASVGHTVMRVNTPDSTLPRVTDYVFWPHLGPGQSSAQGPEEIEPALKMDWPTAHLDRYKGVNDIVQRIPPEIGWRVYASLPLHKGEDNALDFENPFAFYDLAEDHDGWPELVIRHAYAPPGQVWYKMPAGQYEPTLDPTNTFQIVRYNWDQDNDGLWDYKLGLIGKNTLDTVISFPDFGLISIPYDQLPKTLTDDMPWTGGTFVQVEGRAEASPEGVYEWDDMTSLSRQYMFGLTDTLDPEMDQIQAGFRGEYRVDKMATPRLYFSPIDRKLHLVGATAGVWNLGDGRRLRYANLNGDDHLDQWRLTTQPNGETAEETLESLQVAGDMLILSDASGVKLVRTSVPPSFFETQPPRDHAEWLTLSEKLAEHQRDFAADDFLGMANQFQGPTTDVEGATLEDFRLTEAGFRFVLHLQAGFQVQSDENDVGVATLQAGDYLVSYADQFTVKPLTPPRVVLPAGDITWNSPALQELTWTTIKATLHNEGLQDVESLPVRLYAALGNEEPQVITEEAVSIPGKGQYELQAAWLPPLAGPWTIWLDADVENAVPADVDLGTVAKLDVNVKPAAAPSIFRPFQAYDGIEFSWPVALLLASASLAALSALGLILTRTPAQESAPPAAETSPDEGASTADEA